METLPSQPVRTLLHLGGGASADDVVEWEELKDSGFTVGRVCVSICVYVCIRDIFCLFQTEGI